MTPSPSPSCRSLVRSLSRPRLPLHPLAATLGALLLGGSLLPSTSWAQPASATDAAHGAAQPSAAARAWSLPAAPLADTLARIAREGSRSISADPRLLAGRQAPAINAQLTVEDAAQQALQGSGLRLALTSSGTLTVLAASKAEADSDADMPEAAPAAAPGDYTLREVRVQARRLGETEGTGSYTSDAITIGKTAQAMREMPQSVSVVTRQRIEDQNLTDLGKAAEQIVGLTVQDSGSRLTDIYSRGFAIDSVQLDGGAPMSTANYAYVSHDMTEYDRIEVLRGAAGLVNGTGNPGGAVNLVRKMPTAKPQLNITASAGRWDNYRTEIDASGPLAYDGKIRGRGVVSYEDRKYFTDGRSSRKPTVYGVLEADIGPNAVLTVGGRDQRIDETGYHTGMPRYSNGADLRLARNTALSTSWSSQKGSSKELFAKLDWRIAPSWALRINATRTQEQSDFNGSYVSGAVNPSTMLGSRWVGSDFSINNRQNLVDVNLSGAFDLFGRTHELLLGADMQDIKSSWKSYVVQRPSGQAANLFDIDSTPYASGDLTRGQIFRSYEPNDTRQYGVYGTLRLDVHEGTKLVVGARANKYKYNQVYSTYLDSNWAMTDTWRVASATQYSEPTKIVPFGGIIQDLSPQWAAYASYAQIFNPQAYYKSGPAPGEGLKPMQGSNAELGIKGELLDGKLNASLALYRVEQNDRAVLDTRYPTTETLYAGTCCYVNSGKVVSKGLDVEINGEVAPGLNLYAGYTYNHNQDKTGNKVFSTITPKHSLKLFSTWQLPGKAAAWRLGGGATINSTQYVAGTAASWNEAAQNWTGSAVPFAYTQSGYAVWNAMVEHRIDPHWTVTLNVNNLFDKVYYRTMGSSAIGNYYGEPRNWMLTLRGKF